MAVFVFDIAAPFWTMWVNKSSFVTRTKTSMVTVHRKTWMKEQRIKEGLWEGGSSYIVLDQKKNLQYLHPLCSSSYYLSNYMVPTPAISFKHYITLSKGNHSWYMPASSLERDRISLSPAFNRVCPSLLPPLYIREHEMPNSKKAHGLRVHASIRSRFSQEHRDSHRTANDERHFFAPPSRHGRLSGLQSRTTGRGSSRPDAGRARGRIYRLSACADDGNCRHDGLAAVGEHASVHDRAGGGRLCPAA